MEIKQNFVVSQPLAAVWSFFHDVPSVAECLPGAKYLGTKDDGTLSGKVSAKVGPFQASFEGEAKVKYDEGAKKVEFEGKGVDRKGASRGKMAMKCELLPEGDATRVVVVADVQLSGGIAQFGRTGLLTEIANQLVAEFVNNAEVELARRNAPANADGVPQASAPSDVAQTMPRGAGAVKPLNTTSLFFAALKGWLGSFFKKAA
ncbi:SRPBCC family protein [Bradyrhizobium sp. CCGUVB1N3]|uniref:SRPBCC family protein n=1 Tax=Bradyrhizobium sp. CCGUVB1N3 TaxID=2949629 RepID=UPI0020B2F3B9|nr:SRPBCC family protein [Bradyrhizobium sp. CCGUVB1N3]MCP3476742.1 SRPBCC family protein [Bradyrhizobium sp. CCGUVB1N3]